MQGCASPPVHSGIQTVTKSVPEMCWRHWASWCQGNVVVAPCGNFARRKQLLSADALGLEAIGGQGEEPVLPRYASRAAEERSPRVPSSRGRLAASQARW